MSRGETRYAYDRRLRQGVSPPVDSRLPVCGWLVGTGVPIHVCVFDQVWSQGRTPALPT